MTEIESKENLYTVLNDLAGFADESSAVSDLEEKKEAIISVLCSLNRSIAAKGMSDNGIS